MQQSEFESLRALVHDKTGIWLADHKKVLLESRLAKRLRALEVRSYADYYRYLSTSDTNGDELNRAINCVTTNKTDFFRESDHFDFLREWIARGTGARGGRLNRMRVWCAACSTGEEPYTLAITISEAYGERSRWYGNIVATDIDTDVLATARAGMYAEERLGVLTPELRKKYFLKGKGRFAGFAKVRPELRARIDFRQLNLVSDHWKIDGPFDAIFCRNVMIYFNAETQQRLIGRMARLLSRDGYLFVGHSENLHQKADMVESVGHAIYRLREGPRLQ